MKIAILALLMGFSVSSFAVQKDCTFLRTVNGSGSEGDSFTADVSDAKITVSNVEGSSAWEGKYKTNGATVNGKDGKTYLAFAADGGDGCTEIDVDQRLIHASATGEVRFVCRGEGFGEDFFVCHKPVSKKPKK